VNELDTPRLELSDDELALAVEGSLYDLFRSMAALPGAELEELGTHARHHAFPSNPMFKGVWAPSVPANEVDELAEDALAWQRERGAPYVFWWAGMDADEAELDARLRAHGFAPTDLGAPGQVAELDALDWSALERAPEGFAVEKVVDAAGAETWGTTFVEAFGVPGWAGQAWIDATIALGADAAPWDLYVGRLGGRAVATTMMFYGAGVATAFGIGTVPDARGRGIGAAITLEGFADARRRGYRYGVLFATDLGAPVYRRIGFRDTGGTISRWLWIDSGEPQLFPKR
jgi:ribosomal protein S18 acetylase RimI-like enzyme